MQQNNSIKSNVLYPNLQNRGKNVPLLMSVPAIWWSRSGKGTNSVWFKRTLRSFPFDCGRFFSLPSPHSMPSLFTILPRFWVCKIVFWNFLISSPFLLCFFLRVLIASLCFIGKSKWVWNFNQEIWRLRFRVCVFFFFFGFLFKAGLCLIGWNMQVWSVCLRVQRRIGSLSESGFWSGNTVWVLGFFFFFLLFRE